MWDAWKAMKASEPKRAFANARKVIEKAIDENVMTMELA